MGSYPSNGYKVLCLSCTALLSASHSRYQKVDLSITRQAILASKIFSSVGSVVSLKFLFHPSKKID